MSEPPTCAIGPCLAPRAPGSMYCAGHTGKAVGSRPADAVPQGWYVDPVNPQVQRWYSGTKWSDRTQPAYSTTKPTPAALLATKPPSVKPKVEAKPLIITAIVLFLVIGGIVEAVKGNGSGSSSSTGSGGTTQSSTDAKNFIADPVQTQVSVLATGASLLLHETFHAMRHQQFGQLTQIASDADHMHSTLFDFRDTLLGAPGSYKTDEAAFVDAENELKNACGSLFSWTGSLNAASNAQWQDQMVTAVADWNSSVRKLWSEAGAGTPPTITL